MKPWFAVACLFSIALAAASLRAQPRRYYLPYAPASGEETLYAGLLNPDQARAAMVSARGFAADGEPLGSAVETALPPLGHLWFDVKAAFAGAPSPLAWLEVEADAPLHVIGELRGPQTRAAFWASQVTQAPVYMPHVAKNTARFETVLATVNPDEAGGVTLLSAHPDGREATVEEHMAGRGQAVRDLRDYFGDDLTDVDWVRIQGDAAASLEFFSVLPERSQIAALGLDARSGNRLRFLHIAADTARFWTGLVYLNAGDAAAQVAETYFDVAGQALARRELVLEAGQKINPIPLFDQDQGQPAGAAWLEVAADQPLVGYELFGAPVGSGADYFAGLQGNYEDGVALDFPLASTGPGQFSGLAAVNLGGETADLAFTAVDAGGEPLATATIRGVPPNAKTTRLARSLFTPEVLAETAWIRASGSASRWGGFLLWGDDGDQRRFLAGLNAVSHDLPLAPAPETRVDGQFEEWRGFAPDYRDPAGDGANVDFGALWLTHDRRFLYLRLELSPELNLQNSSAISLHIDADDDPATGMSVGSLGAELSYNLGGRVGLFQGAFGSAAVAHANIGLVSAPTVSATAFEIAIRRDAEIGGERLFPGRTLRLALTSDSDRLPDGSGGVAYAFDPHQSAAAPAYALAKPDPALLRLVDYNVKVDGPFDPARAAQQARILGALAPDILIFQEIYNFGPARIAAQMEAISPSDPGRPWRAATAGTDVGVASRFPIVDVASIGANGAFLLDLRADYGRRILVVSAHPPCCGNNIGRQREIDEIMAFVREAKAGRGPIPLAADTPIVIAGDMNLVGLSRQQRTLLTGDIADEATYGPDFGPDWDGGPLVDARPFTTGESAAFTWYNPGSSFSPGRLDYVTYTGSLIEARNRYVLFTPGLTPAELTTWGLRADDTTVASDHLPVVVDVVVK